jgi:hypothetical protein
MDYKRETVYFEKPGKEDTFLTLALVKTRAKELKIKTVLVASTTGETGMAAARELRGCNLVVVAHSTGFANRDVQEMPEPDRQSIEALGGKVLVCQHALGGVGRAVRKKFNTYQLDEIIAHTLRTMGQGYKVCLEIALMAADAGLVSVQQECIAVGGTGRGADTAVVLTPANSQDFFDLKVHEIICKPRL